MATGLMLQGVSCSSAVIQASPDMSCQQSFSEKSSTSVQSRDPISECNVPACFSSKHSAAKYCGVPGTPLVTVVAILVLILLSAISHSFVATDFLSTRTLTGHGTLLQVSHDANKSLLDIFVWQQELCLIAALF